MSTPRLFALLIFIVLGLAGQATAAESHHALVQLKLDVPGGNEFIMANGGRLDIIYVKPGSFARIAANQEELEFLRESGLPMEILEENLESVAAYPDKDIRLRHLPHLERDRRLRGQFATAVPERDQREVVHRAVASRPRHLGFPDFGQSRYRRGRTRDLHRRHAPRAGDHGLRVRHHVPGIPGAELRRRSRNHLAAEQPRTVCRARGQSRRVGVQRDQPAPGRRLLAQEPAQQRRR